MLKIPLLPLTKWCMSILINMPLHSPRLPTSILTLPPPILSKLIVIYQPVHKLQQLSIIPHPNYPTAVRRRNGIQYVRPVGPMVIAGSSQIVTPQGTRPRLHVAMVHTQISSVEIVLIHYPTHPRAVQPTWARVCTIPITPPIGLMRFVLTIVRGRSVLMIVLRTRI